MKKYINNINFNCLYRIFRLFTSVAHIRIDQLMDTVLNNLTVRPKEKADQRRVSDYKPDKAVAAICL